MRSAAAISASFPAAERPRGTTMRASCIVMVDAPDGAPRRRQGDGTSEEERAREGERVDTGVEEETAVLEAHEHPPAGLGDLRPRSPLDEGAVSGGGDGDQPAPRIQQARAGGVAREMVEGGERQREQERRRQGGKQQEQARPQEQAPAQRRAAPCAFVHARALSP